MGIKNINQFLKDILGENVSICFLEKYDLSNLKGFRIAIDAANWCITAIADGVHDTTYRTVDIIEEELDRNVIMNKFYKKFLDFNIMLLQTDITPVWCWDGTAHKEKGPEREKRRADRKKKQDDIDALKEEIKKVPMYLRNVKNLGMVPDEQKEIALKYQSMVSDLRKKMSTQVGMSYDEMDMVKNLASSLGLPSITADHEGEMLCAQLAMQGKVAAVWSSDTDNYAMGTPFLITGLNGFGPGKVPMVKAVILPYIIAFLGITQAEMRELCILCGTDYNTNIKNYGPNKAFKLLQKHKCIECIRDEAKLDITCLNHEICRDYFTPKPIDLEKLDLHVNGNQFMVTGKDILDQYCIDEKYYKELEKIMKPKIRQAEFKIL